MPSRIVEQKSTKMGVCMTYLEIPYVFKRTGLEPRARKETTKLLYASTIIRVPEVTDIQAPKVASIQYANEKMVRMDNGELNMRRGHIEIDYRVYQGNILRRAALDQGTLGCNPYKSASMQRLNPVIIDKWIANPGTVEKQDAQTFMSLIGENLQRGARLQPIPEYYYHAEPEAGVRFARINQQDQIQRAHETSRAVTDKVVLVDGALYLPSLGPGWYFQENKQGDQRQEKTFSAKAIPEMGWVRNDLYAQTFHGFDNGLESAMLAQITDRNGCIEIVDAKAFTMHPDELVARKTSLTLLDFSLTQDFFYSDNGIGLSYIGQAIELTKSSVPCAEQLIEIFGEISCCIDDTIAKDRTLSETLQWRKDLIQVVKSRGQARACVNSSTDVLALR